MIQIQGFEWCHLNDSSNSQVFALYSQNQEPQALKIIEHKKDQKQLCSNNNHERECSHLKQEYETLSRLQSHPNIIKIYDFYSNQQCCALTTELALSDYRVFINKNVQFIKLAQIQNHFKQIAEALLFLHKEGVVHNDVKLENFLYFGSQTIKLADFGHSRFLHEQDLTEEEIYNSYKNKNWLFLSPELVQAKKFANLLKLDETKCDVFAFGVSLFLTVFGCFPYAMESERENDIYYKYIFEKNYENFWKFFQVRFSHQQSEEQQLAANLKDLLQKLLAFDSIERPNFGQVLMHDFFIKSSQQQKKQQQQ